MTHRGPDDFNIISIANANRGTYKTKEVNELTENDSIVLAHARLSIIDLSQNAAQPMSYPDQQIFITYNGEIYNYIELRNQLQAKGISFQTKSDTEVLLASYKYYGLDCLSRFTGMFAFGLIDTIKKQLVLAADPFGIKPLYYLSTNDFFAFASEPKFLLPLLSKVTANNNCLFKYLMHGQTSFEVETFFAQIKRLTPGEYLIFNLETNKIQSKNSYSSLTISNNAQYSFEEAKNKLRDTFLNNVTQHCRSDVPVASLLSGGLDSSAIVSSVLHQKHSPNLQTFSYFSNLERLNESKWVSKMVEHHNISNHSIKIDDSNISKDLENLVFIQDEPFVGLTLLAQYKLYELVQTFGIKVTLDGQGADEIFGGYVISIITRMVELLKSNRYIDVYKMIVTLMNNNQQYLSTILRNAVFFTLPFSVRAKFMTFFGKISNFEYIKKDILENQAYKLGVMQLNEDYLHLNDFHSLKDQLFKYLTKTSLPSLLRYADRNSMASSIESRVPFLTTDLVNLVLSLPNEFLVNNQGRTKYVLREAMRGIMPDQIIDRKDKLGFETPDEHIIRNNIDYFDYWLHPERLSRVSFLDPVKINKMWIKFKDHRIDYKPQIWRLINTIIWADKFNVSFE